ncbi:hypothetical protein APHAL10511_005310 [Amanita phalloides]|nr:hypothetical protein APHAL10511_005310 [Amanita phalloides]
MLGLRLFLTIALSLSTTASGDSRLQRRDVAPVDISNRELYAHPGSADSSELDGVQRIVKLVMYNGRYTGTFSFSGQQVSKVVLDTGAGVTWAKTTGKASSATVDFKSMGIYELHGHTSKGTVKLKKGVTSNMEFAEVSGNTPGGHAGHVIHFLLSLASLMITTSHISGIALDPSPSSWQHFLVNKIPPKFAFYSTNPTKAEFDVGYIDTHHHKNIEWHPVDPHSNTWTLKDTHIKVNERKREGYSITINTGVQYLYGTANDVRQAYMSLKGSKFHAADKFWMVPCDERPMISFSWGGLDFPIHKFLVDDHSDIEDGKKYCRGVLRTRRSTPERSITVGTIFIYGKYVAFDNVENKMGFELIHQPAS